MDKQLMVKRTPKLGPLVQKERKRRNLTLEQLSARSGVSKSMLSQIERGEANPTFAVVWSLTQALEIEFADLFGGSSAASGPKDEIELTSAAHTPEIRSVDGSCRLKILSSPRLAGRSEWYEVEIQPGGKLESEPHSPGTFEHFTAFAGDFEIRSGSHSIGLGVGATARYRGDRPHCITNIGSDVGRGLLVVLYQ